MPDDRTQTLAAIERIIEEFKALSQKQDEALKQVTFVGMTSAEATEVDTRRARINELIQEMIRLKALL